MGQTRPALTRTSDNSGILGLPGPCEQVILKNKSIFFIIFLSFNLKAQEGFGEPESPITQKPKNLRTQEPENPRTREPENPKIPENP